MAEVVFRHGSCCLEATPRHGERTVSGGPQYLYRLEVRYPEEAKDPTWIPSSWGNGYPFSWPRQRVYLSRRAAESRAMRLRSYGCEVIVRRSEPVKWDQGRAISWK